MAVLKGAVADEGAISLINLALAELSMKKQEWTQLPLDKKLSLLHAVRRRLLRKAVTLGRAGAEAKGGTEEAMVVQDMMASVGLPGSYINKLIHTLESIQATGKPPTLPCRNAIYGQKMVKVFPLTWADRHHPLLPGVTAELMLRPREKGVRQGELYGEDGTVQAHEGRLCVMLGGGSHGFQSLRDVLACLFERGEVVALRPHPTLEKWQRAADWVLRPLVEAGYVRVLYLPGPAEARHLIYHKLVDCAHMTGDVASHDAIVWGPTPEERKMRRRRNEPLLKVPITSELGCVTPHIIAGWTFKPHQLEAQALNLVASVTANNGCNCNCTKVLVLPGDWPQAPDLLNRVRELLREAPMLPPSHPGIHERYAAFKARYPRCEVIEGRPVPGCRPMGPHLPFLLNVLDRFPDKPHQEYAFKVDPLAPVLTVVFLPTGGPVPFLAAATRFANEYLAGSLSCCLVIHPWLEKIHTRAVRKAIEGLHYGVVAVNAAPAASLLPGCVTWGALAGSHQSLDDVGSGLGLVCNPFLVEGVQKAIYRVPLVGRAVPRPAHDERLPRGVAKLVLGYVVSGVWGAVRGLWAR